MPPHYCKKYEEIIRTKKAFLCIAYHQGKVFRRFKTKKKFIKLVKEFNVQKTTIVLKINILKLIDKHPKLMKSSMPLGSLKNYYKDSKQIWDKIPNKFE